jgi:hypothetical protein
VLRASADIHCVDLRRVLGDVVVELLVQGDIPLVVFGRETGDYDLHVGGTCKQHTNSLLWLYT